MGESVKRVRRYNLNVFRAVICLDPVLVMRDFTCDERSAKYLLGDESVLIDVPAAISEMMAG